MISGYLLISFLLIVSYVPHNHASLQQSCSSQKFFYFFQLPQDIQCAILDYLPIPTMLHLTRSQYFTINAALAHNIIDWQTYNFLYLLEKSFDSCKSVQNTLDITKRSKITQQYLNTIKNNFSSPDFLHKKALLINQLAQSHIVYKNLSNRNLLISATQKQVHKLTIELAANLPELGAYHFASGDYSKTTVKDLYKDYSNLFPSDEQSLTSNVLKIILLKDKLSVYRQSYNKNQRKVELTDGTYFCSLFTQDDVETLRKSGFAKALSTRKIGSSKDT